MRLKSLEIKGFKSFAQETVLHFDEDVIGVVGPNGSGKSNIVDAIRWVLGEQKGKELRLESMGDVIFNGTKKRKAGAVAQVTLTFDNTKHVLPTEYNTVAISRALYRSGESEYKLNGVNCRLKDITSLLVDTGIGSNSYAIIALGMVDDILSDKENARRKMFEQAAGVSKYKKRKHETLLKLKSTTADLDRIEDLLFEIDGNLKALEKQARRTQRHVDLKTKYKNQSIQLAIRKVGTTKENYSDLEKQIETEKNLHRQLEADLHKKEAQLEKIKKENLDEEKNVGSFQRELNLLVGTIRTMENEKSLLQQKVVFIEQTKKRLEAQLLMNDTKLEILKKEINHFSGQILDAQALSTRADENLKEAGAERDKIQQSYMDAKSNRDTLTDAQQALEKEIFALEKEVVVMQTNLQNLSQESGFAQEQLKELKQIIGDTSKDIKGIDKDRQLIHKDLTTLETKEQKRLDNIFKLREELSQSQEDLNKSNRSLDSKRHEHDLLKDMVARLEGFPESIKFLSKSKTWDVDAPLLSDIIYCDPEFRIVVEHLLEPYLNHFVVKDMDDAADAISILTKSQKGKANFFILDRLEKFSLSAPKAMASVRPLLSLIETDKKYQHLINHLLGNVFITEARPTSDIYDKPEYAEMILIDRAGQYIRKQYSLSGGSVGLFEGKKLGRKKNLEMLAKEIKKLEKEQVRISTVVADSKHTLEKLTSEHQEAELEELRRRLYEIDQILIEKRSYKGHQSMRFEEVSSKMEESSRKRNELESELKNKMTAYETKSKSIRSSSAVLDLADTDFNELVQKLTAANSKLNEVQLLSIQHRNQLDTIVREKLYKEKQHEEIAQLQEQHHDQLENDMVELGEIEMALKNLDEELHEHYSIKKQKEEVLGTAEQGFYQARNSIKDLEDKVRSITREIQNSQYLINQLKEDYSNLKFTIASVSERLNIEFGLRLEDVMKTEVDLSMPLEELQAKVDKLRNRIENFGEINPLAIEAYEEMKRRYDEINEQKNDILEAKDSLMETIREIEITATEKFTEAFDKVREYFKDVFRSLFTEDDDCDLLLEDPTSPLDSKIRIIAKPKGKRPKSLSQLSGGEKTLTATAILFSLYLLKPAPFCIFDEVDAPLDDANIQKFNKIIKKFSGESQFIIVTHNKSTMAAVDVIYGVYMEETGVSSLSQVDFRGFEHEELLESITN